MNDEGFGGGRLSGTLRPTAVGRGGKVARTVPVSELGIGSGVARRLSGDASVRLRVSVHRRVRVPLWRSFPPETESNCVVATRGGEQLEVNG